LKGREIAKGSPACVGNIKTCTNNNESNIGAEFTAAIKPSYDGDEFTVQRGINIVTVGAVTATATNACFDEPLSRAAVLSIVDSFIV
jgi:hypothetical protein